LTRAPGRRTLLGEPPSLGENHGTADSFPRGFFYVLVKSCKNGPERFEQERKDAIEAVITSAPEHLQKRLRGIQWRVDIERSRASNPLSSAIRLNKMMMDFAWSDKGFPLIASLCREVCVITKHMEEELSLLPKK